MTTQFQAELQDVQSDARTARAARLWQSATRMPVQVWQGSLPLPAVLHPGATRRAVRWALSRQRYLLLCVPVAVLSLSASQQMLPVAASPARAPEQAVENESYYYDGVWAGTIPEVVPVATVPAVVQQPAQTPYGVGSASALTASGIPAAAYRAYVDAAAELARTDPGCGIHWSVVAGIGRVESNHGRFGGSTIGIDGVVRPPILGIRLDGSRPGTARISDSDGGKYDGDAQFDRAVGPMQFIPGTWKAYGGGKDPQDMNAAALATARYLCAGGGDLRTQPGRWAAVYRYNHSDSYVSLVLSIADSYASGQVVTFPSRPTGTTTDDKGQEATPGGKPPAAVEPKPVKSPVKSPTTPPTTSATRSPSASPTRTTPTAPATTTPPTAPATTEPPSTTPATTTPGGTTEPTAAPTTGPTTPAPVDAATVTPAA